MVFSPYIAIGGGVDRPNGGDFLGKFQPFGGKNEKNLKILAPQVTSLLTKQVEKFSYAKLGTRLRILGNNGTLIETEGRVYEYDSCYGSLRRHYSTNLNVFNYIDISKLYNLSTRIRFNFL